ncbi:MAG: MEDS domain-containing protein [Limisphaerales bacterium]
MKYGQNESVDAFWKAIDPGDHILQLYENEAEFMDMLERFVRDGFENNESVVVIATAQHLNELKARFKKIELADGLADGKFFPLDAAEALSRFMVNNWPDNRLFHKTITAILGRATHGGHKVRAFGEMVALLWAQGNTSATIRVEDLWNNLKKVYRFPLFCAYPRGIFTENADESIKNVCATHSRMVPALAAC